VSFNRATISEFWRNVQVGTKPTPEHSECWNYIGSDAYLGYKAFRCVLAHRAAAVIYLCEIPARVSQTCGNKHCVRLDHLRFGTRRHELTDDIKKVLAARPPNGRKYNVMEIRKSVPHLFPMDIRGILRESALYDLMFESQLLKAEGKPVRMEPFEVNSYAS